MEVASTVGEYMLVFLVFPMIDSSSIVILLTSLTIVPSFIQSLMLTQDKKVSRASIVLMLPSLLHAGGIATYVLYFHQLYPNTHTYSNLIVLVALFMKSAAFYETNDNQKRTDTEDNITSLMKSVVRVVVVSMFFGLLESKDTVSYLFGNSDYSSDDLTTVGVVADGALKGGNNTFTETGLMAMVTEFYNSHFLVVRLFILSGIVTYAAGLACRLHMQQVAFTFPLVVIPICAWITSYCACENQTIGYWLEYLNIAIICPSVPTGYVPVLIICFGVLWASSLIVTYYLWTPNIERMAKNRT